MADIQYLNYGDQQIEQQALLNNLANQVQGYVQNQPWSNKRKEKFMSAYLDIINKGITGASNTSGQWELTINGDLNLNSLSQKDKEMYQEAAYFIRQQMAGLPTKSSLEKEEEEKKADLPLFDNTYFTKQFGNHISNQMFGGREFDTQTDWNSLDARNENGLRGRSERAKALAKMLQSYSDSLEEGKYNFEGSPFENLQDFKNKVGTAIQALNTSDESDDIPALNAIGLKASDWFNNGSGDLSGQVVDGNELTYAQLAEHNKDLATQQQQIKIAEQKALVANRFSGTRRYDISKLNGSRMDNASLESISTKLAQAQKLDDNDLSKIAWSIKQGIGLSDLSREEFIKMPSQYRRPHRLKKIAGLEGIYLDTVDGSLVQPFNVYDNNGNSIQDIINQNNPETFKQKRKEEQEKYLNNTNWTSDQWREIGGIAADVVSVIDPEPVSAGISALTGTGLRTWNRAFDKDGFTWKDAGHTALDAGLSLLGMIPVVGDAALTARVIGKLQKAAGWMGAIFAAAQTPQAAKAAWNKVVNGKDLTVDDWRAIGNVLMGVTQARRIHLNRAAGNAVKNQAGGTKKENFGEVEVKINGKTEKVEIDEASTKELQQAYKKAGNNIEETSKALRNSRAVREKLEAKKGSDGKPVYTKEQLEAIEAPQAGLGNIKEKMPRITIRDKDIRGIKMNSRVIQTEGTPIPTNAPLRVQYMQNNSGFFKRGDYGWNLRTKGNEPDTRGWFRRQWDKLTDPYNFNKTTKSKESISTVSQEDKDALKTFLEENPELRNALYPSQAKLARETRIPTPKNSVITKKLIDGSDYTLQFENIKDKITVVLPKESKLSAPELKGTIHDQKAQLGKWITEQNVKLSKELGIPIKRDSQKWQEFVKSIKDLKRNGYLFKQGGTIDKQKIQKYKEFIHK